MNNIFNRILIGDRVIWYVVILLSLISFILVYSASSQLSFLKQNSNTEFFLFKQIIYTILGISIATIISRLNINYISNLSTLVIWISIILLILVLIKGEQRNSATRWIFGFQPSELAKIGIVLYLSRQFVKNREELKTFKTFIIRILIPILALFILIAIQNGSTALLLLINSFVLILVSDIKLKFIIYTMLIGLVGLVMLVLITQISPNLFPRADTWTNRILTFTNNSENEADNQHTLDKELSMKRKERSDNNYQIDRALSGIASGGLIGKGPGNSIVKAVLPSAWSDFIFAILIEEYGIIFGGILVLLLYIILLYRIIKISSKSEKVYGKYIVFGLGFSILTQAFVNILVSVNLIPVTGQPLPLISMGGTSLVITFLSIGIIQLVAKDNNSLIEKTSKL